MIEKFKDITVCSLDDLARLILKNRILSNYFFWIVKDTQNEAVISIIDIASKYSNSSEVNCLEEGAIICTLPSGIKIGTAWPGLHTKDVEPGVDFIVGDWV